MIEVALKNQNRLTYTSDMVFDTVLQLSLFHNVNF